MSHTTLAFTEELYDYYQKVGFREPEILKALRERTQTLSMRHMQISPEQGQFMAFLISLMNPRKILEIGTFTGYSTLAMALATSDETCIIACDVNVEWTRIAKQFWKLANVDVKIDLRLAPALQTLKMLIEEAHEGSFDFIFIDADKSNYPNYYEIGLRLLRRGGIIAIDNVLWKGKVADSAHQDEDTILLRQLNQHIYEDDRVALSMLPIGDGLTLCRKL